jgi:hypothetical protein
MPPTIVRDYQQQLIQTILDLSRQQNWWSSPINLGGGPGDDGGSGIPIGNFFGQLIQSKVAFDTTEAENLDIPVSGSSLVTNLNRIRYRIGQIEGSGGVYTGISIWENGVFLASGITNLDLINFDLTVSGNVATISGGFVVQKDDILIASGVTVLNFEGSGVQDVSSDGPNKVTVTLSGGGGGGVGNHALSSSAHTDVDTTGVVQGDVLTFDGDFWVASGVTSGTILQEALSVFEDVTSQIPANNDFYTVTQTIASGSAKVHVNGLLQLPSYYTEATSGVFLTETLVVTDELIIEYLQEGSTITKLQVYEDGAYVSGGIEILDFVDVVSVTSSGVTAIITHSGAAGGNHALGSSTHTDVIITSPADNEVLAYDSGGDWINQTAAEANLAIVGHTHLDIVDVSANDTTAGYLEDKIVAGNNITITTLNEGANETVEITSTASGGGSSIVAKDEGVVLTSGVTSLDFVGGGVIATAVGNDVTITIASGVGGGGVSSDGSYWEPLAAPASGTVYDDEFSDSSFDTGLWTEFDPDGIQTVDEQPYGLRLVQSSTAGDDLTGIYQSIPAGDFTIVARVSGLGLLANFIHAGLALWDDATSSAAGLYVAAMSHDTAGIDWVVQRWNHYQSWNNTLATVAGTNAPQCFIRIRRNGTTYNFDFSSDGIGWMRISSTTLVFTPNEFGLFINNNNQGVNIAGIFQFFRYRSSDVGLTGNLDGRRIAFWDKDSV